MLLRKWESRFQWFSKVVIIKLMKLLPVLPWITILFCFFTEFCKTIVISFLSLEELKWQSRYSWHDSPGPVPWQPRTCTMTTQDLWHDNSGPVTWQPSNCDMIIYELWHDNTSPVTWNHIYFSGSWHDRLSSQKKKPPWSETWLRDLTTWQPRNIRYDNLRIYDTPSMESLARHERAKWHLCDLYGHERGTSIIKALELFTWKPWDIWHDNRVTRQLWDVWHDNRVTRQPWDVWHDLSGTCDMIGTLRHVIWQEE